MKVGKKMVPAQASAKKQAPKKQSAAPAQMKKGAHASKGKVIGK